MSSNNNDGTNGAIMVIAMVSAVAFMVGVIIFAVAAFLAYVFTILSLCAWNKPLRLFGHSIEPEEARAFVGRGLLGLFLLPAFAVFAALLFDIRLNPEVWPYLFVGGYTAGSVGIEYLRAQIDSDAHNLQDYTPPPQPISLPSREVRGPKEQPPFQFASWDDEEER